MAPTTIDPDQFVLWYHPGIPGRAEFIRAYLEATGTQYVEPVKDGDYSEMAPYMSSSATSDSPTTTAFAPPALLHSGNLISQTSAILGYLEAVLPPIDLQLRNGAGEETKTTEPGEVWARQALMQTIADCVAEVHNTHHPIDMKAYYEDQKAEAARYAAAFRKDRLPKFITHFERQLRDDGWLYASGPTYVDLALWVLVRGLKFAFPNALGRTKDSSPKLIKHFIRIQSSPRIQAYLECDRHLEFSNGIFRNYAELDPADD